MHFFLRFYESDKHFGERRLKPTTHTRCGYSLGYISLRQLSKEILRHKNQEKSDVLPTWVIKASA